MDTPQQRASRIPQRDEARAAAEFRLVERLRAGDEAALRELIASYSPRLLPYIRDVVKNHQEAEDVLQLVFWKVWRRIDSFRGESAVSTWIYRIALNAAIDWRKHKRVERTQCVEDPELFGVPDDGRGPADQASGRDLSSVVRAAMMQLPEKFRTVLLLREIEGLSYEEIAESLHIALGTVESRIFRARAKLAKLLKDAGIS